MIDAGYYLLERRYGKPAVWNVYGAKTAVDTDSGVVTRTKTVYNIIRCILADDKVTAIQDLALKLAKYGGAFDMNQMILTVRRSFCPLGYDLYNPNTNDEIVYDSRTYNIVSVDVGDVVILKLRRAK